MKTEEENMLYIKKYSGFIISIVIGLLLYEEANYAYTYRAATAYSDHMIYRLILSMGSGSSGWNGILFPILAALPMGISYVREYRSGYLNLAAWVCLFRMLYIVCIYIFSMELRLT